MFDSVLPKVPGPPTIEVGGSPPILPDRGSITKSAPYHCVIHCPLPEPCTGRSCGDRPRGPAPPTLLVTPDEPTRARGCHVGERQL
eukprot:1196159-Prorocentrum_minimum.AAC.6